jgi:DNA-binding NarL/FixJ family response regulator
MPAAAGGLEVTVIVVEDDPIVRAWVQLAFEGTEFRLVGEAGTVAEALELFERRRPQLLLVDFRLPDGTAPDLIRTLRAAGETVPALVVTATPQAGLNESARAAGANGSALKSGEVPELLKALRVVRRGGESFDYRHPKSPAGQAPLSHREREVLRLVAGGATNREVAAELKVGSETVKTLLARIHHKLGTHRRAEAVDEAHRRGLL